MNLAIVSFEQAKALKELGFDWDSIHYSEHHAFYVTKGPKRGSYKEGTLLFFDDHLDETSCPNHGVDDDAMVLAPTVALALKWLRDEKGVCMEIYYAVIGGYTFLSRKAVDGVLGNVKTAHIWKALDDFTETTYEEAESAALNAALKLLQE